MVVKYSEDVRLEVNITEGMIEDYQRCRKSIEDDGFGPEICKGCRLNVDLGTISICDIPDVKKQLEMLQGR